MGHQILRSGGAQGDLHSRGRGEFFKRKGQSAVKLRASAVMIAGLVILALCSRTVTELVREEMLSENPTAEGSGDRSMKAYDFSVFTNVEITGAGLTALTEEEPSVLYAQAWYCQAMTEADIDVMQALVAEDKTFTHMSGKKQTREEYFADVADGSLDYFTIGIADPVVTVDGDRASVTYGQRKKRGDRRRVVEGGKERAGI